MTKKKKMLVALGILLVIGIGLLIWGFSSGKIKIKADTSGSIRGGVSVDSKCEVPKGLYLKNVDLRTINYALLKPYETIFGETSFFPNQKYAFLFWNLASNQSYFVDAGSTRCLKPVLPNTADLVDTGLVSPTGQGVYAQCKVNNQPYSAVATTNDDRSIGIYIVPKTGIVWGQITGRKSGLTVPLVGAIIKLANGGGATTNSKGYYQLQVNEGENVDIAISPGVNSGYDSRTSQATILGCQGTRADFTLLGSDSITITPRPENK